MPLRFLVAFILPCVRISHSKSEVGLRERKICIRLPSVRPYDSRLILKTIALSGFCFRPRAQSIHFEPILILKERSSLKRRSHRSIGLYGRYDVRRWRVLRLPPVRRTTTELLRKEAKAVVCFLKLGVSRDASVVACLDVGSVPGCIPSFF